MCKVSESIAQHVVHVQGYKVKVQTVINPPRIARLSGVKTFSGKVVRLSLAYLSMHKWLVGDLGRTLLPEILGQIDPSLEKR